MLVMQWNAPCYLLAFLSYTCSLVHCGFQSWRETIAIQYLLNLGSTNHITIHYITKPSILEVNTIVHQAFILIILTRMELQRICRWPHPQNVGGVCKIPPCRGQEWPETALSWSHGIPDYTCNSHASHSNITLAQTCFDLWPSTPGPSYMYRYRVWKSALLNFQELYFLPGQVWHVMYRCHIDGHTVYKSDSAWVAHNDPQYKHTLNLL